MIKIKSKLSVWQTALADSEHQVFKKAYKQCIIAPDVLGCD